MQQSEELLKAGLDGLARQLVMAIKVGREMNGEEYMQRLEQEFRDYGRKIAAPLAKSMGIKEGEADCLALGKIIDYFDSTTGAQWEGYVQRSPDAFEKRITSCPVARTYLKEPDICGRLSLAMAEEMFKIYNPKASVYFAELLCKGDDSCRVKIDIKK